MHVRTLVLLLCLLTLISSAYAGNIIVNPGFETGSLAPWFNSNDFCSGCTWAVTSADAHTGLDSALVVGNRLLEQDFAGVPTSTITEASLWLRMPDTGIAAIFFKYSDSTTQQTMVYPGNAWNKFDVTSSLDAGKSLVGFGVYGCSGCGAGGTRADDFMVNVGSASVPEPATWLLLGPATGLLALLKIRRS